MNTPSLPIAFYRCAVLLIVFLASCAGSLQKQTAQKAIAKELNLPEKQVKVLTLSGIGGTVAADATLQMTFLLQKDSSGEWKIFRVKRSDNWEDPQKLKEDLQVSQLTRSMRNAFVAMLDRP
ncbi:MAG TPA: hypothetical protein VFG11_06655 [Acidobacteriota bacterium]|nr:hypothetical protein [Acidobacteriota bacterium]